MVASSAPPLPAQRGLGSSSSLASASALAIVALGFLSGTVATAGRSNLLASRLRSREGQSGIRNTRADRGMALRRVRCWSSHNCDMQQHPKQQHPKQHLNQRIYVPSEAEFPSRRKTLLGSVLVGATTLLSLSETRPAEAGLTVRIKDSSATPPPPPPRINGDGGSDSPPPPPRYSNPNVKIRGLDIQEIRAIVEEDFDKRKALVSGEISKSIYSDNCTFADPQMRTRGLNKFVDGTRALFKEDKSELELLGPVEVIGNNQIFAKFREVACFNVPLEPRTYFTGNLTLTLGEDNLIEDYLEQWDKSVEEIVRSAKFFGFIGLPGH